MIETILGMNGFGLLDIVGVIGIIDVVIFIGALGVAAGYAIRGDLAKALSTLKGTKIV